MKSMRVNNVNDNVKNKAIRQACLARGNHR